MPATLAVASATFLGLLIGGVAPNISIPQLLVLLLIFLQTIIGAGALADSDLRAGHNGAWLRRVLLLHLGVASTPLCVLGLIVGLDTPIGVGAFVLGAAPPAIGLPTYVAACRGDVPSAVRVTATGYTAAVVITPLALFLAFGSTDHLRSLGLTLVLGLIAPLIAAIKFRPYLTRIPRRVSFGLICLAIVILMTDLGAIVQDVVTDPTLTVGSVALAVAIGVVRSLVGAVAGGWLCADPKRRVEAALAVGTKNSVLAAVIAAALAGPLAAVPAIVNAVTELILVIVCSTIMHRGRGQAPV